MVVINGQQSGNEFTNPGPWNGWKIIHGQRSG